MKKRASVEKDWSSGNAELKNECFKRRPEEKRKKKKNF